MLLYIFYFFGLANVLVYFKLKKEMEKNQDLYDRFFSNASRHKKSPSQRSHTITAYILSQKKWDSSISSELRFWLNVSRFLTLGYVLYGVIGIVAFFIMASAASVQ